MISQQLLRVPFYGASFETQLSEAFAFAMASFYAGQEISARMLESYKRCWDFDFLDWFTSIPAGRPGYLKVTFGGDYRKKYLIAIRGTESWAQLLPIRGGAAPATVAYNVGHNLDGEVYGPFATYANTIWDEISANTTFWRDVTELGVPLVLTGFSLGAAVAEVLAAKIKRQHPTSAVRLIKFASPNVGTLGWSAQQAVQQDKTSVYLDRDPIQLWPNFSPRLPGLTNVSPVCMYGHDPVRLIYDLQGQQTGEIGLTVVEAFRSASAVPLGTPARSSIWWYHQTQTYRYAMLCMLNRVAPRVGIRLQTCELNDENSFGDSWSPGMDDWASLFVLRDPPPADWRVRFTDEELRAQEEIRYHEAASTVARVDDAYKDTGSWGAEPQLGDLLTTSDWGAPPSVDSAPIARVMRTTRTRRPVVPIP